MDNKPSFVTLVFKNGDKMNLAVKKVCVKSDWFDVNERLTSDCQELLLDIRHPGQTTLLNLTETSSFLMLHFDETGLFLSSSYSVKKGTGSYLMQTRSRFVLFVRLPTPIPLQQLKNIIFNDSAGMESDRFSVVIDGKMVAGEIVRRAKDHVRIKIVSPYTNWYNDRFITGQGRMSPIHFLTARGDEVARELLTDAYLKLHMIDDSIDRITGLYKKLEEEKVVAAKVADSRIKERIISKVEDWFFDNALFVSSVTGLIASVNEQERIIEIINAYRYENRKIYMK